MVAQATQPASPEPPHYDAFLSYSTKADYQLVRKTKEFLETFHRVAAPGKPLRPLSACVDGLDFSIKALQDTLRGAGDAERERAVQVLLETHLARARCLIILCAGLDYETHWRDVELKWWLEFRPDAPVYLAVTRGENPATNPALFFSPRVVTAGLHHQIWFDLRGHLRRAARGTFPIRDFDEERTRIAAELYGTTLQEVQPLWFRAQRARERQQRLIATAVAGVTLSLAALAATGGVVAWNKARESQERLENAYASNGNARLEQRDPDGALPWFVAALRLAKGSPERELAHRVRVALALARGPALEQTWATSEPLERAVFSPDGRLVAVAVDGGEGFVADAESGRIVAGPVRHEGDVNDVAFSPDGKAFVTASDDHTARVWSVQTGQPLLPPLLHGEDRVVHVAFSPGGAWIVTSASGDESSFFRVWDAATGALVGAPMEHGKVGDKSFEPEIPEAVAGRPLERVAFARDGTMVSVLGDLTARLWTLGPKGPTLIGVFPHDSVVLAGAISGDGRRVVTGASDGTIRVWDLGIARPGLVGTPAVTIHSIPLAPIVAVGFDHAGRRIVACGNEGAQVFDATTGTDLTGVLGDSNGALEAAFSFDDHLVATSTRTGSVQVWSLPSGRPAYGPLAHFDGVWSLEFAPRSSSLLTASRDQLVRLWRLPGDADAAWKEGEKLAGAAPSPDGKTIGIADMNGQAWLADSQDGGVRAELPGHSVGARALRFSADGTRAITNSGTDAFVWNVGSGEPVATLRNQGWITSVTLSADGSRALTADRDGAARLWSVEAHQPIQEFRHPKELGDVRFDRTETRVVTASDDSTAQIWDVATGAKIGEAMKHHDGVSTASFRRDALRVVTASQDGTAHLWDAKGRPVGMAMTHAKAILDAEFSPDGESVATASLDGTVRLWDAASGTPKTPPMPLGDRAWNVAFDASGRWLLANGIGHTARIFDTKTGLPVSPPLQHGDSVRSAAFATDGSFLVTASEDGFVRRWDWKSTDTGADALEREIERRTLRRVDLTGGVVQVDLASFEKLFRASVFRVADGGVEPL